MVERVGGIYVKNKAIAQILTEISILVEVAGEQIYKARAYSRAARSIRNLGEDIEAVAERGELTDIPGIGKGIAEKIDSYLETGSIDELERLRKKVPINVAELESIPGVGPKTIKLLYDELKIVDLDSLERAARAGKIVDLKGMGEKTVNQILEGIELVRSGLGRTLLADALMAAERMGTHLSSQAKVKKLTLAGSIRRRRETIGDVDILVDADDWESVVEAFVSLDDVEDIIVRGTTKTSIRLKGGLQMDLRLLPSESYGAGLQYFTGSVDHNVRLRSIARKAGLKLNEYGLFKEEECIAGENEVDIYRELGLDFVVPELRENTGEVEAAQSGSLPDLISQSDIRGDLHGHTDQSDGANTLEEMLNAASALDYEYYCVSDHTQSLTIANGMDEDEVLARIEEIDKLNASGMWDMQVLKGTEVDILANGEMDLDDAVLEALDIVTASIHSRMKDSKEKMTERVCTALENPHVHVLGHPTGRLLLKRPEYEIDLDAVFEVARRNNVVMELNAHPMRLDLNAGNLRKATSAGLKIVINTDAHRTDELENMRYGLFQARRGWLTKDDVINTYPLDDLLKVLRK
ncbi:DNA polymerase/3'-5' exonuclease PolX [Candidatus Thorarchaeota archaeon]|nr:MAG: DNA polymerase/3'-5' exonuclease PolX [Candidatus Thorarchaeota archaeon]